MDEHRQDNRFEPIYDSSVPIQGIYLKISWEQWMIETGGERRLGRSVLEARHDDDDDDDYAYLFKSIPWTVMGC